MEFKAKDIAAYLGGSIIGDGDVKISEVSKIEEGKPGSLTFLANKKYENYIYTTQASAVLISEDFVPRSAVGATLIKVKDAYQAFASLLDMYIQAKTGMKMGIEQPSYIDSSAVIGEDVYVGAFAYIGKNAKIGNGVKIYPHAFIGENVTVGDDCFLYAGSKVYDDCIIGDRCIIHAGAVIGADGFGFAPQADGTYKKIPQIGNVILEDDVDIGANSTLDCGTIGSTIIRKGAKIDNLVQVAHNCEVGENTVIAAQTGLAGSSKVGKNCRIAGQVGVAGHLAIGDNVTIGAQSGVSKSVKSNETLFMSPAFSYKDAIKAAIIFRNLPQMQNDLNQLKRDINHLKSNSSDSSK